MRVFISYSSADEVFAKKFCNILEARGYCCWISCRDLHKPHEIGIPEELRKPNTTMISLISNASLNSPGQKTEARYAVKFRKDIVPVLIESIPNPSGWVEYVLTADQHYQLNGREGWKRMFDHLSWLENGNDCLFSSVDQRIREALEKAKIKTDFKLNEFGKICSCGECKHHSGSVNIKIYFDSQPEHAPKTGQEIISIYGVCQFKGFEREQIIHSISRSYKSGKWAIECDGQKNNLANGFILPIDASASIYRNVCEEILSNFSDVIDDLNSSQSSDDGVFDSISNILTEVIAGGALGIAALGVADQLGIFDDNLK